MVPARCFMLLHEPREPVEESECQSPNHGRDRQIEPDALDHAGPLDGRRLCRTELLVDLAEGFAVRGPDEGRNDLVLPLHDPLAGGADVDFEDGMDHVFAGRSLQKIPRGVPDPRVGSGREAVRLHDWPSS